MRVILFHRNKLGRAVYIAIFAMVLNVIAIKYSLEHKLSDIDNADLHCIAGRIIVIDPGHGGVDSGAMLNNIEEKNITMEIALRLAEIISSNGGIALLTRDGDIDDYTKGKGGKRNDLMKRAEIINGAGADMFLSIHVNSYKGSNKLSGAQVFYNPQKPENKELAEILQCALSNCPVGNRFKVKDSTHIFLLKETMPAGVLIETGYISNPAEAANLCDHVYQKKLAEQIVKGLAFYFGRKSNN